jgi:hypothetical protein
MFSLLYVSVSLLEEEVEQPELAALVEAATSHNLTVGLTGALVLAGGRFAQALEGPEKEVTALMGRITVDPRHTRVRVIRTAFQSERQFPNWGMAQIPSSDEFARLAEHTSTVEHSPRDEAEALFLMLQQGASARLA